MTMEQRIDEIEAQHKKSAGRIALLEALVGGLVNSFADETLKQQLISRLGIIKIELLDMGIPSWKNDVLSIIEEGPSPDGPGVTLRG